MPSAQSEFTPFGAEFYNINLALETIRREILLYGFWNFKFKACGLGYHRKDLRAARRLKI